MNTEDLEPAPVSAHRERLYERPLPREMTRWVAASLLQKAVRRNELVYALQAASDLLSQDPARFWRRCMVIAAEEIGIADLGLVSSAIRDSHTGRRTRSQEATWTLASSLVARMCSSRKCRASDDLAVVAEYDPKFDAYRCSFAELECSELLDIAFGSARLEEQAVALWTALGSPWAGIYGSGEHGGRQRQRAVLSWLQEERAPAVSVALACDGYRETREIIFPLLMLLAPNSASAACAEVIHDQFPEVVDIEGCPSWAYDGFTREGRRAIAAFIKSDCRTADWVRSNVLPLDRIDFVAGLVFRVESGLVRSRTAWGAASDLRKRADRFSHGASCRDALDLLATLTADLPVLNEARLRALRGSNAR